MAKFLDAYIDIPFNYCVIVIFHETKFTSFSVLKFVQSYIGKFIVLLATTVMPVGLVQFLSYLPGGLV